MRESCRYATAYTIMVLAVAAVAAVAGLGSRVQRGEACRRDA
jgi:ABC-type proline/glycine betaine transport system permease subunit